MLPPVCKVQLDDGCLGAAINILFVRKRIHLFSNNSFEGSSRWIFQHIRQGLRWKEVFCILILNPDSLMFLRFPRVSGRSEKSVRTLASFF
ncbi:MAG: hypothetical protein CSA81_06325 [Acidobacteria bacterium]|nr:MAG: hypothetical protein CSA81_06325 [Acidobacteriota bacterium]